MARICSSLDIEVNEFYREDIIVEDSKRHLTVRLASEQPVEKKKRKPRPNPNKKAYRFTEAEFLEVTRQAYERGFEAGRHAAAQRYQITDEEIYMVAEEIVRPKNHCDKGADPV